MAFYDGFHNQENFVTSFTADPKNDFGVFAKGYTLAANRLANMLLDAPRFSDYEAYPVVFLYRQALELSLKNLIYSSVKLAAFKLREDVDGNLRNIHDLNRLSQTVERLLSVLFPKDEGLHGVVTIVRETCAEFSSLDPKSDAYRYPIDSKGLPSTKRHQVVNLRALGNRMSSVLEDLDTIHFGLNIETDRAQEVYEIVQGLAGEEQ